MYRESKFGLKVRFSPDEAKKELLEAYKAAGCDPVAAAQALDISWSSFERFVVQLDLRAAFSKLRGSAEKQGWRRKDQLRLQVSLRKPAIKPKKKSQKKKS